MTEKEIFSELNHLKNNLEYLLNVNVEKIRTMPTDKLLFTMIRGNENLDYYDSEVYKEEYNTYLNNIFEIMRNLSLYIALNNIISDSEKIKKANYVYNFLDKLKNKIYEEFDFQTIESLTTLSIKDVNGIMDTMLKECCVEEFSERQVKKEMNKNVTNKIS